MPLCDGNWPDSICLTNSRAFSGAPEFEDRDAMSGAREKDPAQGDAGDATAV
jgi:hypothetical protein